MPAIRLHFVGALWAAALAVLLGASTVRAALPGPSLSFLVERGGSPIGTHKVTFRKEGDELDVRIDIELAVSFGPITVFRYEHHNHEVWRGGRLVSIKTHTDDDGKMFEIKGRATEKGFEIDSSSDGHVIAPANIIPASYWNPDTPKQTALLDTQRGRVVHVAIAEVGENDVLVNGTSVPAHEYEMTGDLRMHLWYTDQGQWVKLGFTARGSDVAYAVENIDGATRNLIASR